MKNPFRWGGLVLSFSLALAFAPALAQSAGAAGPSGPLPGWQAGAVLDVTAASRALALGQRDKGLGLGHSDLSAFGPLGQHVEAQLTAAAATHDRRFELELEEAWFQSRSLPAGLQVRAGRFASQIGALNEQHPHADDFVERPLLYRAFLGGHWNDDGIRLNWTAPTDFYLRLGAEAFRGKRLVEEAASAKRPGAVVLSARVGGDIGESQSWQAGLSFLHNRREASVGHEEEGEVHEGEEEDHGHAHSHAHGAAFSGRRMWLGEVAWKWAPQGNNRQQQLRVAYERAVVRGINRHATRSDRHVADYLSVVWRFAPSWEVGARTDMLKVRMPHEDHFDNGRLRELAVMLAYKPTHQQTFRVQATHQKSRVGFDTAGHAIQLQYIVNWGAHAAHSF
ncbi:hypothetical protein FN976_02110 [Caenimonas sedimenti]|uniref:Zinc-regulated TonB-dependent outer membrane receptor n=1 Tax=Caenimonas sedimenti TaxID=2596921 RepID=A0A562ZX60_9BURK|nr:hypothetical protein [Caenimonas sedimenti]TWO73053.1 hypothetical protein FN976_02110 [Caenimonas sedimenti]